MLRQKCLLSLREYRNAAVYLQQSWESPIEMHCQNDAATAGTRVLHILTIL